MTFINKIFNKENKFIYNTFLVIVSGLIVKSLGLLNKIFITRLLSTNGMSLYILAFPTIILFISLSGFSLNTTASKLIAESIASKNYSPKKIINSCLKLAIITSSIVELCFLLSLSFLVNNLLKTPDLYYPLLMTAFLIPLVGVTDTFRGVFGGLQQMNIVSKVNIIEQITRIAFSIGGILLFSKYGVIPAVSITIFALTIGEACSLFYLLLKLKKINIPSFNNTNDEKKAVWKMAFPTTLSRLIGSFTYFLEPIINTLVLLKIGFNKNLIDYDYTVINAYVIPLLTICVFLSNALATTAIPAISEKSSTNKNEDTLNLIDKIFFMALIPGIIISILLFFYPNDYLQLLFSTSNGSMYIKKYVFIFLFHYIQSPGIAILQALGNSKKVLSICSFYNVLRLLLIFIFAYFTNFGTYSIFYAIITTMVLETLTIWIQIRKSTLFIPNKNKILNLILIIFFILVFAPFLNIILNNYIIKSIILIFLYFYLIFKFKIIKKEGLVDNH